MIAVDGARERVVAVIEENADAIVSLSKYIHANPEIAMQEFKSSKACADLLEHFGFKVERNVADIPTAFSALAGDTGPLIAYLSEYDALPGLGHGCGHQGTHGCSRVVRHEGRPGRSCRGRLDQVDQE